VIFSPVAQQYLSANDFPVSMLEVSARHLFFKEMKGLRQTSLVVLQKTSNTFEENEREI
jgi:hypothetical protein